MVTLDHVVTDAKATGGFEGSVEDIRASSSRSRVQPDVIETDASCAAKTELTKLIIDRGISFNDIVQTIVDGDVSGGSISTDASCGHHRKCVTSISCSFHLQI